MTKRELIKKFVEKLEEYDEEYLNKVNIDEKLNNILSELTKITQESLIPLKPFEIDDFMTVKKCGYCKYLFTDKKHLEIGKYDICGRCANILKLYYEVLGIDGSFEDYVLGELVAKELIEED